MSRKIRNDKILFSVIPKWSAYMKNEREIMKQMNSILHLWIQYLILIGFKEAENFNEYNICLSNLVCTKTMAVSKAHSVFDPLSIPISVNYWWWKTG